MTKVSSTEASPRPVVRQRHDLNQLVGTIAQHQIGMGRNIGLSHQAFQCRCAGSGSG
jgi:hypothetical protein